MHSGALDTVFHIEDGSVFPPAQKASLLHFWLRRRANRLQCADSLESAFLLQIEANQPQASRSTSHLANAVVLVVTARALVVIGLEAVFKKEAIRFVKRVEFH